MSDSLTLPADESARLVGCRSVAQFRREVAAGVWPVPMTKNSRPQRWSRAELEMASRGNIHGEECVDDLDRALGLK